MLVGTNLVRLSDLQGIDADCYKKQVLPGILDQVIQCRDAISQEYLLECVISVFPDEFHLITLEPLLKTCQKLHERVAIRKIVVSLLERLVYTVILQNIQMNKSYKFPIESRIPHKI